MQDLPIYGFLKINKFICRGVFNDALEEINPESLSGKFIYDNEM